MQVRPAHVLLASVVVVPLAFAIAFAGGIPSPHPALGHWRAFVAVSWTYHWEPSLILPDRVEIVSISHEVEWRRMLVSLYPPYFQQLRLGEHNKFKLDYACFDRYGNVVASGTLEFALDEACREARAPATVHLRSLPEGEYLLRMEVYQLFDVPLIARGWHLKDVAEYEFSLTAPAG